MTVTASEKVRNYGFEEIAVLEGRRPIQEAVILTLMESISRIGLLEPIIIRYTDWNDSIPETFPNQILVTGGHRLEACRRLGWKTIPCRIFDGDLLEARLWEIAENLHRADLTVIERVEQTAEWIRITEQKQLELAEAAKAAEAANAPPEAPTRKRKAKAPVAPAEAPAPEPAEAQGEEKVRHGDALSGGPAKGGRGKEGGVRAAARLLGVPEKTARRAVKLDTSLGAAAKKVIKAEAPTMSAEALERIAKEKAEKQEEAARKEAEAEKERQAKLARTAAEKKAAAAARKAEKEAREKVSPKPVVTPETVAESELENDGSITEEEMNARKQAVVVFRWLMTNVFHSRSEVSEWKKRGGISSLNRLLVNYIDGAK